MIGKINNIRYIISEKLKKKIKWTDDNVLHCPEYMIEGAKLLENEPEKYFNATYNWYYAGKGNLQVFNWYGTDYLIHADFNNLCKYLLISLENIYSQNRFLSNS